jgi:FkbM family methyltransferase
MITIKMYYTNSIRNDGFGAIYQNIVFDILHTEYHGHTFVYTSIPAIDHNYNNDLNFTKDIESFMNIKDAYTLPEGVDINNVNNIPVISTYPFVETNINALYSTDSFKKIKYIFYKNKTTPFTEKCLHVSVHIRRPNYRDDRIDGSDTPDSFYLRAMNTIRSRYVNSKIKFHIYSQGDEKNFINFISEDTEFHLNEDVKTTFLGLVYADILITSRSSFSYLAALLSKGTVFYQTFWHPPLDHWIKQESFLSITLTSILQENGIPFENNKIKIPAHIKHIKLDIGLSYSAPHTQEWLLNEQDLMVFGFEPNPDSVASIKSPINTKKSQNHGDVLENKYINTSAFIIPIALGIEESKSVKFYVTSNDVGCSSLYKPMYHPVKECIEVPVFRLSQFFDLLPEINYIEYIKIDTQGSDLNIIKSGGDYIREKVVFVTLEPADGNEYSGADHNVTSEITKYMSSIGFMKINHPNTSDPTYVNSKFIEESKNIYIRQI